MYPRFSFTSQNETTNFPSSKSNGLAPHLYSSSTLTDHNLNKLSSTIFANSSIDSGNTGSGLLSDTFSPQLQTVAQQQQQRLRSNETVLSMMSSNNNMHNVHESTDIINNGQLLWNNVTSKFYPQFPFSYELQKSSGSNSSNSSCSSSGSSNGGLLPTFKSSANSAALYTNIMEDNAKNPSQTLKTNGGEMVGDHTFKNLSNFGSIANVYSSANLATVTSAITANINEQQYVFNDASSHSNLASLNMRDLDSKHQQTLMPIVNMNIFGAESPSFSPTSATSNVSANAGTISIYNSAADFDPGHGLNVIGRGIYNNIHAKNMQQKMNEQKYGIIGNGSCGQNKAKRRRMGKKNKPVLLAPMTNIKCIFCSKVCLTRSIFHEHCQHQHKKKCGYCGKFFGRNSNLMEHIRVHTGDTPYKCTYCSKGFKQQHSLKDHIRTHTGEKPFGCQVCSKRFKVKHNLKVHMRVHTGEKPYQCHICNRKFTQKGSLNTHTKKVHP